MIVRSKLNSKLGRVGLLCVLATLLAITTALSCDDTDPSPVGVHPDPAEEDSGASGSGGPADARTPAEASVKDDGGKDASDDGAPPPPPPDDKDAGDAGDGGT
jgi:hypothetical protein